MNPPKTKKQLQDIYDILCEYGALESDRNEFIHHHSTLAFDNKVCSEWRFQGKFGFGGKYRVYKNQIDYYQEDKTPEMDILEEECNKKLLLI